MKTVKDLIENKPGPIIDILPDKALTEAASNLVDHNIGALIVTNEKQQVLGILSERDILRQLKEHPAEFQQLQVKDAMTEDLYVALPEDELDYVMSVMVKYQIRHLPVIDAGKLIGILSVRDVIAALKTQKEYENHRLRDYISGDYPG